MPNIDIDEQTEERLKWLSKQLNVSKEFIIKLTISYLNLNKAKRLIRQDKRDKIKAEEFRRGGESEFIWWLKFIRVILLIVLSGIIAAYTILFILHLLFNFPSPFFTIDPKLLQ